MAGIGALLGMLIFQALLGNKETVLFNEFLKGQGDLGGPQSILFWAILFSALLGATAGFFSFLEIPVSLRPKANRLSLGVALFLIPLVIYIPAMSAGFLWDDDQEITSNPSILEVRDPGNPGVAKTNWRGLWEIWTGGITCDKDGNEERAISDPRKPPAPFLVTQLRVPLRAIEEFLFKNPKEKGPYRFTANQSADYFPLKTSLLWVEYQLWGREIVFLPPQAWEKDFVFNGFHVMNILVHALDGLLLWMVLRQLKVPGAWLGSLLFAIHPVHAESVAWIAERKNTLSLMFCLLSLSAWLRFEVSEKRSHYLGALILFVAALLCKTHVVVFPAVLLLITWWKMGKITLRDCARTAPFFAIALALALVTIWFQNDRAIGGEVIPIGDWPSRFAGAGVVVWSYLVTAIAPINLNTIYANTWYLWWPLKGPQAWMFLAGALVPMTLAFLWAVNVIYPSRSPVAGRTPFFVFAYFVGTLFPVLGFFTMSYMRLTLQADHFQYFSDISIVALAGALFALAFEKAPGALRQIAMLACVALVTTWSAYSWVRAGVHHSEKTLWTACLKRNNDSWQAHNHIGAVLYSERRLDKAKPHFEAAVRLKPENPEVHNNLGLIRWNEGHLDEAIAQYREAVRIKGDAVALRHNFADALFLTKQYREAAEQYQIMVKDYPKDPNLRIQLGVILAKMKRTDEARKEFETALSIDRNHPYAREQLDLLNRANP